jgi:hypothetical protein
MSQPSHHDAKQNIAGQSAGQDLCERMKCCRCNRTDFTGTVSSRGSSESQGVSFWKGHITALTKIPCRSFRRISERTRRLGHYSD